MKNSKLKIAMLGQKRVPSREGGIEVVVEELSTRMVEHGAEVTCYNRKGHKADGDPFNGQSLKEYKGVKIKEVFTIKKRGLAAMTSSIAGSLRVAFGNYDVIHYHAEGPAMLCWLPKLFGKKIVVTVHGLDHRRAKWGKLAALYIILGERSAVRFADEIIVLSRGIQQYFLETYGRDTRYISNGVNRVTPRIAEQITDRWGLEKDKYILYLGRIVPEKGERILIQAFRGVQTDKKLVIAGGSSDTEEFMKELKELALGDERIVFTDFVQGRIKHELYSNAYVYTLPSELEGMPLSLLEAMSYGNCCLTSDIAECAEVVEDKAVLFANQNMEDLREKLQTLCDRPEMVQKYKESAAEYILQKYNWDSVVEETMAIYDYIKSSKRNKKDIFRRFYCRKLRKKLRNTEFSLFASNCNGACILHDLGVPFNSPFVNLWMKPAEYIRFLGRPEYYLSKEMRFVKEEGITYPIGEIEDIRFYFMHYISENEVKEKWERRCRRVDFAKLFVLLTERDGCTYEDLCAFDALAYENKVVFTHVPYPEIASAVYIPGFEKMNEVGMCMEYRNRFSVKKFYDAFDYVSWFNRS